VEHERLELSSTVQNFQDKPPMMGSQAFDTTKDEKEIKKLKRQLEFFKKQEKDLLAQINKPM